MQIRPVSDLRNKFPEVEKCVESGEPVYLTKNGYGSMVVMSIEMYDKLLDEAEYNAYKERKGIWSISDYSYKDSYCYKNGYKE